MRIFAQSFQSSLRSLGLPLVGAMALCALCLHLVPHQADTGVDQSAGQWLHLPGLLLVAAGLGAALEAWPLLSRARPGFAWVLRIENRPLHGCLAAALGSLAALGVSLVAAAVAFAMLLAVLDVDQGDPRSRTAVRLEQTRPFLDNEHTTLVFHTGDDGPVRHLRLRPNAFFSSSELEPARIEIRVDGIRMHEDWMANAGEAIQFDIEPPRSIRTIQVRRRPGPGLLLRLPADRVEVESSTPRSAVLNCILALLSYLVPAALAFAVMIVGHRHLALPVNFTAGLVACLLATLTEVAPNTAAITGFARGRWLLGEGGLALEELWLVAVAVALVGLTGLGQMLVGLGRTRSNR